jgi:hypothetical protein
LYQRILLSLLLTLWALPCIGVNAQQAPASVVQVKKADEKSTPLSFYINFVFRSGGKGELKTITSGAVLKSGDHYKATFIPEKDCHVYIFQADSSGQIFQLFPMKIFNGIALNNVNPVKKDQTYIIPSSDKAFVLDNRVGTERVYFIASQERNQELETLYKSLKHEVKQKNMAQIEDNRNKLNSYFKRRGMHTVTPSDKTMKIPWKEDSDIFSVIGHRLENLCKDCVHILEFYHQ